MTTVKERRCKLVAPVSSELLLASLLSSALVVLVAFNEMK